MPAGPRMVATHENSESPSGKAETPVPGSSSQCASVCTFTTHAETGLDGHPAVATLRQISVIPASAAVIIDMSSLCKRLVTAWLSPAGPAAGLPDLAGAGMPATVCAVLLIVLALPSCVCCGSCWHCALEITVRLAHSVAGEQLLAVRCLWELRHTSAAAVQVPRKLLATLSSPSRAGCSADAAICKDAGSSARNARLKHAQKHAWKCTRWASLRAG